MSPCACHCERVSRSRERSVAGSNLCCCKHSKNQDCHVAPLLGWQLLGLLYEAIKIKRLRFLMQLLIIIAVKSKIVNNKIGKRGQDLLVFLAELIFFIYLYLEII